MIGKNEYSDVFKAMPTPCLILLPNKPVFTIVAVSDTYLALTSTTREQLIGKHFFDIFPSSPYRNDAAWKTVFDEVLRNKTAHRSAHRSAPRQYTFPLAGSPAHIDVKYVETVNTPVLNEQGEISLIVRSLTDVTDTIYRDKFLEETQHIVRIGSWQANISQQTVTWSAGMRDIFEVPADYALSVDSASAFFADEDARITIRRALEKAMNEGGVFRVTLPIITAKGNERWVLIVGKADLVDGSCVRIYGLSQDITEKKNTEKALISSQYDFQNLVQTVDGIVWEADAETLQAKFVSHKVEEILGYKAEEWLADCGFWPKHIYEADRDHAVNFCHQETKKLANHTFDYRMVKKNGDIIWVRDIVSVISKSGKPRWLRGIIVDITEQKQLADLAAETAAMMAQGQALAGFGNWQWDIKANKVVWSPVLYDIYGLDASHELTLESYLTQVHDDDKAHVIAKLQQAEQTGVDTMFEERIIRPDGSIRHLRSWAKLIADDSGAPSKMIGACLDITEAKLAELKLKSLHEQLELHLQEVEESEQKYSDLFHLSPLPMWVYDMETYRFLDVNTAAIVHYGYTREEFLSMTIMDIRPIEEIPKIEADVAFSMQHDELFTKSIYVHQKKNGEIIQVEVQSNIICFHGRKAEVILAQDITDKLYYIDAIETQNKKLQEIAWMQSHLVRAPLARIMGLVDLIQNIPESGVEHSELLNAINSSAIELDGILRNITDKAEQISVTKPR